MKNTFICSDVHEDLEALAKFADYAQAREADHILFLGDMSYMPFREGDAAILGETKDLEAFRKAKREYNSKMLRQVKSILDNTGIGYNVIPGNYDPNLEGIFDKEDMHKRTSQFGDARMFGYGGADAFPPQIMFLVKMGEIVDFDHQELYDLLKTEEPEIIMSHLPPMGLCDDMFNGENIGTLAIAEYIAENSPKLVLSGHVHEAGPYGNNPHGVKGLGGYRNKNGGKSTIVVNPGNVGRFMHFDFGTFVEMDIEDDGSPITLVQYSMQGLKSVTEPRKIGEYDLSKIE